MSGLCYLKRGAVGSGCEVDQPAMACIYHRLGVIVLPVSTVSFWDANRPKRHTQGGRTEKVQLQSALKKSLIKSLQSIQNRGSFSGARKATIAEISKTRYFWQNGGGQMEESAKRATVTPSKLRRDFSADFLDRKACMRWIIGTLHPRGVRCPSCKHLLDRPGGLDRLLERKRVECPTCGRFFDVFSRTMLTGIHADPRQIVLMLLLISLGATNGAIAQMTGQSDDTVSRWRLKYGLYERFAE